MDSDPRHSQFHGAFQTTKEIFSPAISQERTSFINCLAEKIVDLLAFLFPL